jgi:hypothetical protein
MMNADCLMYSPDNDCNPRALSNGSRVARSSSASRGPAMAPCALLLVIGITMLEVVATAPTRGIRLP